MSAILMLLLGGALVGMMGAGSGSEGDAAGEENSGVTPQNEEGPAPDQAQQEVFTGGENNDTILSGMGDDTVHGGGGDDIISDAVSVDGMVVHSDGNGQFFGGDGNDSIWATGGRDMISGEAGDDLLSGMETMTDRGPSGDTLVGGAGNDTLVGDYGDILIGGEGQDLFGAVIRANDTTDMVVIEDFSQGDFLSVEITDPALLPLDAEQTATRETDYGVVVSVAGQDVALVRGPDIANFDASSFRVIDAT